MPTSDDFDRHTPDHVAPLVAYLASNLCRFTGRVFAIEGPDVAIYGPAAVVGEWKTETQWTLSELVHALSAAPNQISSRGFFHGGPVQHNVPLGRMLKSLGRGRVDTSGMVNGRLEGGQADKGLFWAKIHV